jgi:hypothetical protein
VEYAVSWVSFLLLLDIELQERLSFIKDIFEEWFASVALIVDVALIIFLNC